MTILKPEHTLKPGTSTLAQTAPHAEVRVVALHILDDTIRKHLNAYGLVPGRKVRVLSNRPVIIVQVEETELALEISVAKQILVEG